MKLHEITDKQLKTIEHNWRRLMIELTKFAPAAFKKLNDFEWEAHQQGSYSPLAYWIRVKRRAGDRTSLASVKVKSVLKQKDAAALKGWAIAQNEKWRKTNAMSDWKVTDMGSSTVPGAPGVEALEFNYHLGDD